MFSDVVLTLKTISKDFTEPDRKFHDADNIIRRIITKYVEQNPNAKLNMPVDESAAKSSAAPEAEESVEEKIARIRRIVKRLGVEMMAASAQEKAKLAQKIKLYDVKIKSLTKV